jgi:hypothetical protein
LIAGQLLDDERRMPDEATRGQQLDTASVPGVR